MRGAALSEPLCASLCITICISIYNYNYIYSYIYIYIYIYSYIYSLICLSKNSICLNGMPKNKNARLTRRSFTDCQCEPGALLI